jgi:hypothetical protein
MLADLVGSPGDLDLAQWLALHRLALESRPDLLFEVGRGYGNSTVVLTEAAHTLDARVISVGNDEPSGFETRTWPRLSPIVGETWRTPLDVVQADVLDFTPPPCARAFLFWDAHGPEVAKAILGRIIPELGRLDHCRSRRDRQSGI